MAHTTAGWALCWFQAALRSSTQAADPLGPRGAPLPGALTKPMSASMDANWPRMSPSISSVCPLSICLRVKDAAACLPPCTEDI